MTYTIPDAVGTARGETRRVRISDLTPYPGNPRASELEPLADSLDEDGQYKPVVVQASTGHILAGNHTVRAAAEVLGETEIDAYFVDVTDERALVIVLKDNKFGDLGGYDQDLLRDALREADALDLLESTHYTDEELADLIGQDEEVLDLAASGSYAEDPDPAPRDRAGALDAPEPPAPVMDPPTRDHDPGEGGNARLMLVLDLPAAVHDWAVDNLEVLVRELNVDTDAEAVLRLIADARGVEPPPMDPEERGDAEAWRETVREVFRPDVAEGILAEVSGTVVAPRD
jgi:hypothetical protein